LRRLGVYGKNRNSIALQGYNHGGRNPETLRAGPLRTPDL
jgi:hypothetical protein